MLRLVNIVDDHESARASISFLLHRNGYEVQVYASGDEFLAARDIDCGCVLLNLEQPEMGSLDVLAELARRGVGVAVVILSRAADIPTAVRAMQRGAVDVIELPYDPDVLVQSTERALSLSSEREASRHLKSAAVAKVRTLTPRESQILQGLCEDMPNKVIARRLELSPRTVESYRATMMAKIGATNLAQALQIASNASFRGPALNLRRDEIKGAGAGRRFDSMPRIVADASHAIDGVAPRAQALQQARL